MNIEKLIFLAKFGVVSSPGFLAVINPVLPKRNDELTERVWIRGFTVPDERVCSLQPNLHKDVGNLSRGEYKTNLLDK